MVNVLYTVEQARIEIHLVMYIKFSRKSLSETEWIQILQTLSGINWVFTVKKFCNQRCQHFLDSEKCVSSNMLQMCFMNRLKYGTLLIYRRFWVDPWACAELLLPSPYIHLLGNYNLTSKTVGKHWIFNFICTYMHIIFVCNSL
jgi:hypothetical protein